MANFLPKHGQTIDTAALITRAEEIIQGGPLQSGVVPRCLVILRNVKTNLLGNNEHSEYSPSVQSIPSGGT